jgi:hypothetical protein
MPEACSLAFLEAPQQWRNVPLGIRGNTNGIERDDLFQEYIFALDNSSANDDYRVLERVKANGSDRDNNSAGRQSVETKLAGVVRGARHAQCRQPNIGSGDRVTERVAGHAADERTRLAVKGHRQKGGQCQDADSDRHCEPRRNGAGDFENAEARGPLHVMSIRCAAPIVTNPGPFPTPTESPSAHQSAPPATPAANSLTSRSPATRSPHSQSSPHQTGSPRTIAYASPA